MSFCVLCCLSVHRRSLKDIVKYRFILSGGLLEPATVIFTRGVSVPAAGQIHRFSESIM